MKYIVEAISSINLIVFFLASHVGGQFYSVDDDLGFGRRFDGIGGLSGGSATSKLLIGYPDVQRDEILDYMFKPKFGAALQILKIEIGGDAQASDATEASHMHNPWEENYNRGYEWWLMKEAKKRNPNIKLYGLPWDFPGWLGKGTQNPYTDVKLLADYTCRWVNGAKVHHNLTIDFIGIWNERHCDTSYVAALRQMLDDRGYANTRIVAGDDLYSSFSNVYSNTSAMAQVDILGSHYPGTISPDDVMALGKTLWSSEDYSTFNNEVGGGCWARILNQNYVNGLMTSTIAWNLIDSFYQGLPWDRDSLMTAREPWSGNYIVESPIWMSAHTTQLTEIGWHYLPHKHGVGKLQQGGSYVSLASPDLKDLTIVIETMSAKHSACIRPPLPPYTVKPQNISFILDGSFNKITHLYLWCSILRFDGKGMSSFFEQLEPLQVVGGIVSLSVGVDEIYSLTTLNDAHHGDYPAPPPSAPFPLPFFDDFESYPVSAEPYILAPQQGSYEVVDIGGQYGHVVRQLVLQPPVAWHAETLRFNSSLALLGRINWTDVAIEVDVQVGAVNGSNGIFLGVRIDKGGLTTYLAKGIFLFIFPQNNTFLLTNDIQGNKPITSGRDKSAIVQGWNKLTLSVRGQTAVGTCNGVQLFDVNIPKSPANGFVGVGTDGYGIADFDNVHITNSSAVDSREDLHHRDERESAKSLYFYSEYQMDGNPN